MNKMFSWYHLLVPWNSIVLPSQVMLCYREKLAPKAQLSFCQQKHTGLLCRSCGLSYVHCRDFQSSPSGTGDLGTSFMVNLPCLDSTSLPTQPAPQFRVPLGLSGSRGARPTMALPLGPSFRTGQGLCHQGQVRTCFPFSFSPLFSFSSIWLCYIVLGLVLERGPWTQLPKLSMRGKVDLLFGKAVGVLSVGCLVW